MLSVSADVLGRMFSFMSEEDALNVASTNSQLMRASAAPFRSICSEWHFQVQQGQQVVWVGRPHLQTAFSALHRFARYLQQDSCLHTKPTPSATPCLKKVSMSWSPNNGLWWSDADIPHVNDDDISYEERHRRWPWERRYIRTGHDTLRSYFHWDEDVPRGANSMHEHVQALAGALREGRRVPLARVAAVLDAIVPPRCTRYALCRRSGVQFTRETSWATHSDMADIDRIFPTLPRDHNDYFGLLCDRPAYQTPPFAQKGNSFGPAESFSTFYAGSLLLRLQPTNACDESCVQRYQERFRREPGYAPTVLAYNPFTLSKHLYGTNAVILDGHHKLMAAVRLGRPVQLILAQDVEEEEEEEESYRGGSPFPWVGGTKRDAYEYLAKGRGNLQYRWKGDHAEVLPRTLRCTNKDHRRWFPKLNVRQDAKHFREMTDSHCNKCRNHRNYRPGGVKQPAPAPREKRAPVATPQQLGANTKCARKNRQRRAKKREKKRLAALAAKEKEQAE